MVNDKAEACFSMLAVARHQGARTWSRAAMSLARFWRDQGKRERLVIFSPGLRLVYRGTPPI
jgi:type II secretory pathway component PulM